MLSVLLPLLCFILFFSSCVSFNFDSLKDQTAQGVVFQAPSAPYKQTVKEGMDVAWENQKNNDTLSFFSNCSPATQFTSLKQFQKELLHGLKTFQLFNKKEVSHQNQEAYYLYLNQFKNKKKSARLDLFLFKKANCFYVLSFLMSTLKKYTTNRTQVFKNFIREFRAP